MASLHKGWLAFGVELDSFCERETTPHSVSIGSVGMASLNSSKLYGVRGVCSTTGTCTPTDNSLAQAAISSAVCTSAAYSTGCTGSWDPTAGNAPGKHNFIGFSAENCVVPDSGGTDLVDPEDVQIVGSEAGTATNVSATGCSLDVNTYDMGVYGHVSGSTYFGASINQNSVLSDEQTITTNTQNAVSGC